MNISRCALCGENEADTRDHVPPKGIFPKPRPSNLVTVPACLSCNNSASTVDESFLVHLGLQCSLGGDLAERVFDEQALPALKHNSRLRRDVLAKLRPRMVYDELDNALGEVLVGEWDKKAHIEVLSRTVRGLHFHHFNEILSSDSEVTTQFFYDVTEELIEASKNWALNVIGEGELVYRYTYASRGNESKCVWLFEFFGSHWAGGQAHNKDRAQYA